MALGRAQYSDVIASLAELGLPAEFIQTGGMNPAIEVQLETGAHRLITDAEEPLSWHREDQRGWAVGLYPNSEESEDPEHLESTESNEVEALLALVKHVLARDRRRDSLWRSRHQQPTLTNN